MDILNLTVSIFIFITGLCIGSFLNVVILRTLSDESIIFPQSKCPKCQNSLKWWHNIPLISYVCLKGKCAFCHEKISLQYPLIEFTTGYLFLITYLKFGCTINFLFLVSMLSLFVIISTIDIKEHVAFNLHSYILAGIGIVYNLFNFGNLYTGQIWIFNNSFLASILGLLVGAGIIAIYFGLGYVIFKTMIIGAGDIFIAGALGACFGVQYIWKILLIAVFLQILAYIPLFFVKLYKKKDFITISLLITFAILTAINYTSSHIFRYTFYWISLVLLILNGLYLCKRILESLPKDLAEQNEKIIAETLNSTKQIEQTEIFHLPFAPALCCASILILFFLL